jgi:tetratricopeptide (TPR) repeat protein
MYQLIYSIVITLLLAGCAVQHETITLPEKNEPVVLDNKESDRKETKEETSDETLNAGSVKQKALSYIHQKIKDPEKVKQIEPKINAMSEKEVIEWLNQIDSENNIPPERQHWNEIMQQVVKAYQSGHYSQGIEFAEKAYQYALNNFGETDQDTLKSINYLAGLYKSQGRYGKAEPLYKRFYQLSEEVLGPKHTGTITLQNYIDRREGMAKPSRFINAVFNFVKKSWGQNTQIHSLASTTLHYYINRREGMAKPSRFINTVFNCVKKS